MNMDLPALREHNLKGGEMALGSEVCTGAVSKERSLGSTLRSSRGDRRLLAV